MKYMFAENEKKIAQEWKKYQGYTVRPVPSTLAYYKKIIKSCPANQKFMLYGGTPEIRSIFQEQGYSLTLVDRSREMLHAMGLLTGARQARASGENLVNLDWLQLDKMEQQFDLLVGDDAINMVKWTEFDLFLEQARKCLRPQGKFICHLLVKPDDNLIGKSFLEVEQAYHQGKIRSIYDLASALNFICYDQDSYRMGWQQTIQKLGSKKLARFKPDLDFIEIFGLCNSYFYCPPIKQFEALVTNYFTIKDIFYPVEYDYCLLEPIFVLEKK